MPYSKAQAIAIAISYKKEGKKMPEHVAHEVRKAIPGGKKE